MFCVVSNRQLPACLAGCRQEVIMKTIVLNAGPRKNWNTAQLLKAAMAGAKSTGAEAEYIDLYDLNFTGCRSCMLCKRKDVKRCHCYWKDELSPVIDKVYSSDTLLIGTPIYFGRPTSQYFAFMERLRFPTMITAIILRGV